MIKISVFYPNEEGKRFDKEHFLNIHIPLVEKAWGTSLKKKEIDIGVSGQGPNTPAPFVLVVHLYFDSIEAIQSAWGPQHQKLAQQTPEFTDIKPISQLSTVATDQSPDNTIEDKPSRTAAYVAFCRALSFRDERIDIKGPDSLAHLFISDELKKTLKNADSIRRGISFSSQIFGTLVARTAFFDDIFKKAIADGIRQIVLLGAGYDTRAYRFGSALKDATIYEMDIISTQNRKRTILREAGIVNPQHVKYVNINFKTENIKDTLLKHGFDSSIPTIFLWEGVTYYLTEEIFSNTLKVVKSFAPSGSSICFDYQARQRESVATGEPFQFWISPEALNDRLLTQGIEILDHINNNEMEKRYLTLSDGTIAEKASDVYHFVHARFQRN